MSNRTERRQRFDTAAKGFQTPQSGVAGKIGMTHFFDRKDPWGNGMAVWVVMAMVFAMPLAWWSLSQTRLENDVEKWLPADDPELKILQWANSRFSFEERVFV
jgi:hypothetical protein